MVANANYGPDAQVEKSWGDLTAKQRNVVNSLVDLNVDATQAEVGENAGVAPSYVSYVEKNFPHIIEQRRSNVGELLADGKGTYTFDLARGTLFDVLRDLPTELAEKVFRQTVGSTTTFELTNAETLKAVRTLPEESAQALYSQLY